MKTKTQIAKGLIILLLAGSAGACDPTLPDLQPFAKATDEMSTAIARGYEETVSQYAEANDNIRPDPGPVTFPTVNIDGDAKDCGKEVNQFIPQCFAAREEVCKADGNSKKEGCLKWSLAKARYYAKALKSTLNGMNEYSASLAAIADAGKKGKESVGAVAESLTGLISAATPIIAPLAALNPATNPAIAAVISAAQAINGYVARVRARKELREAVNDAAEAVAKLEIVLHHAVGQMQIINRDAGSKLQSDFRSANVPFVDYHERKRASVDRIYQSLSLIDFYFTIPGTPAQEAEMTRLQTYQQIQQLNNALPQCPGSAACSHDQRSTALNALKKESESDLKAVRQEITNTLDQYKTYAQAAKGIHDRANRNMRLLEVADEAITAWARGHKDVQSLLNKNSRRATFNALIALGKELVVIYEESKKGQEG